MNDIKNWFDSNYSEYLENLENLVNIDSGSHHKSGVTSVLNWICEFLEKNNIPVEKYFDGERLICVSACVNSGSGKEKSALLLGHCDTVFPFGEVQRRPFKVEGDTAFGPGVADMKAGVLMNAYLLRAWKNIGASNISLSALFTCDEEIGSPLSGKVIEAMCLKHKYVFNSEPGRPNGNVVIGRKGGVFFNVEIEGKAAHAGANFYDGISAISALSKKIHLLEKITNKEDGITLNVGLVRGGLSVNTVAPNASAEVDLRINNMDQREKCLSEVVRICESSVQGETSRWSVLGEFKPFVQSGGSKILAEKYLQISLGEGVPVKGEVTGGCSDSGIASACGCDVVCAVGPIGGGFHTENEYVRLDSVGKKASVLFKTLLSLG